MIGTLLGDYELKHKLGEGSTGETYLAVHRDSGHQAAVKVLFPSFCSDSTQRDRFFAEVLAASKVNHVGIADLYHAGVSTDGRAFLAMEFLEGKTLTDSLIELGAVSEIESLADVGWQLATLLAAVHASGLRHGCLKPDAIYLTFPAGQAPRPLVKLLDFGMSQFSLSVRHSQTGSLLGAPLYMAPEIARGLGNVDHRADIYSLGCILFEMACGRPPFVREGKGELLIAHTTEVPPPLSSLEPSIPQAIDALVGRMLTKNPATRPQSMDDVASVMAKFFDCPVLGGSVSSSAMPPPAPGVSMLPATLAIPPASPPAIPSPPSLDRTRVPPQALVPPSARRQDPTALLPPSTTGMPTAVMSGPEHTWIDRVRQRTAVVSPSDAVAAANPPAEIATARSHSRPGRPEPRPGVPRRSPRRRPPRSTHVSIPVVVATASAVLLVGAAVLILRGRGPSPSPPSVEPQHAPPLAETFQAPTAANLALPIAPDAAPATKSVQPSDPTEQPERPHTRKAAQPRVVKFW